MNHMRLGLALCGIFAGCSDESSRGPASDVALLAEKYWIEVAPLGAIGVIEARDKAGVTDEIVVVGRVGDFVDSRGQFNLTDLSFLPCNQREGDSCRTPWDFCCEPPDELAAGTVVVEFRDGKSLETARLEDFHGFDHLKEVVVAGHAERDESGNVTIVARGVHVRP